MMSSAFGFMGFGFVFWLLMLLGLVLLIRWLIQGPTDRGGSNMLSDEDEALRELRLRFARGEIDEAEYLRRRRLLEEEGRP